VVKVLLIFRLQVKEARDASREVTVLIQHLHRFVQEQGPAGDWSAWLASHVPLQGQLLLGKWTPQS